VVAAVEFLVVFAGVELAGFSVEFSSLALRHFGSDSKGIVSYIY
jgi:hypothetical protein